jgi:mono/diheme cytochrome c family protein
MRLATLLVALAVLPLSAAGADIEVRANYLLACRGCHLADGSGVPPEVPSLKNTLSQFTVSPEGRNYLVRVPGASQSRLNDAQLAEVINWVLTEFNADTLPDEFQPFTASEVTLARKQILADPVKLRSRLAEASAIE